MEPYGCIILLGACSWYEVVMLLSKTPPWHLPEVSSGNTLTEVRLNMTAFWNVAPCSLA
jgi:hypothetical protein